MLSASYFSLLAPAAEISGIIPICGGFLLGAGFVTLADWIIGDVDKPEVFYGKLMNPQLILLEGYCLMVLFLVSISSNVKAE